MVCGPTSRKGTKMASPKMLSSKMQAAAVRVALDEGKSLDQIEADFPELDEGVKMVKAERAKAPKPRGSGPTGPIKHRRISL